MMFRLALALGRTIPELEASLSVNELMEWAAYWEIEPFGAAVDDQRFEMLCQLIFRANTDGKTPVPIFFDRDPEETARRKAAEDAKMTLDAKIMAYFGAPGRAVEI